MKRRASPQRTSTDLHRLRSALTDADPELRQPEHEATRAFFARTAPRSLGFARVG